MPGIGDKAEALAAQGRCFNEARQRVPGIGRLSKSATRSQLRFNEARQRVPGIGLLATCLLTWWSAAGCEWCPKIRRFG